MADSTPDPDNPQSTAQLNGHQKVSGSIFRPDTKPIPSTSTSASDDDASNDSGSGPPITPIVHDQPAANDVDGAHSIELQPINTSAADDDECQSLFDQFQSLDPALSAKNGVMDRSDFRDLLHRHHIGGDLVDAVFDAIDTDRDSLIAVSDYVVWRDSLSIDTVGNLLRRRSDRPADPQTPDFIAPNTSTPHHSSPNESADRSRGTSLSALSLRLTNEAMSKHQGLRSIDEDEKYQSVQDTAV